MSVNTSPEIPDYDLDDMVVVTAPVQLRALSDDLRGSLLELVLERAATVTELAQAVGRPKSTVAYHVNLLVDAGLFKVVRTQRVRAIEERYYGRVARTIYIGALSSDEDIAMIASIDGIATAYSESRRAKEADDLRCTLVHARIPVEDVRAFWAEVQGVARKFAQIPAPATRYTASWRGSTRPTPPRSRSVELRSCTLSCAPCRRGGGQATRGATRTYRRRNSQHPGRS